MHSFSLGEKKLCLDIESDRLWLTNDIGAAILTRHLADDSVDAIADWLVANYDVVRDQARADVALCIDSNASADGHRQSITAINRQYVQANTRFEARSVDEFPIIATLHLPGFVFRVHSDMPELAAHLQAHYRLTPAAGRNEQIVDVAIYRDESAMPIVIDGKACDAGLSIDDVMVKLHRELTVIALEQQPFSMVLHAAGVMLDGYGVLLPALGGSGKTTLTAWLLAKGFKLLNDDLLGLSLCSHSLNTAPVAMSIKSGSWPVVAGLHAEFGSLPVYGPADRPFRYLPPTDHQVAREPCHASMVVVPQYDQNVGAMQTSTLTPDGLFAHLIESGSLILRPFEVKKIESLVRWLNNVDIVRIRYSDLADAEALIRARVKAAS